MDTLARGVRDRRGDPGGGRGPPAPPGLPLAAEFDPDGHRRGHAARGGRGLRDQPRLVLAAAIATPCGWPTTWPRRAGRAAWPAAVGLRPDHGAASRPAGTGSTRGRAGPGTGSIDQLPTPTEPEEPACPQRPTSSGPLDRQGVFELIRDQLADILEIEPSTITESSSFAEDLDADSLALIELVEALEEELGSGRSASASRTRTSRTCAPSATRSTTSSPSSKRVDPAARWTAPTTGRRSSPNGWGTRFADPTLLLQALSHRCWCAEQDGAPSNERLEFLGDAVLGLVVADHSYRRYPELPEGDLAKVRSAVVNTRVLAEVGPRARARRGPPARARARSVGGPDQGVDPGRRRRGGDRRRLPRRRLGDGPAARAASCSSDRIERAAAGPDDFDHKTRLQEMAVRARRGPPPLRGGRAAPTTTAATGRGVRGRRAAGHGRGLVQEGRRAGGGPRAWPR